MELRERKGEQGRILGPIDASNTRLREGVTDERTDGRTDGRTDPLIEIRRRI